MEVNELIKIVDSFYPKGIALNDPTLFNHVSFMKLMKICREANDNQVQWINFINEFKGNNLDIEVTEFNLLPEFNPSFIAVFLTEDYVRPKVDGYQPLQLILKLSVISPTYIIYFDNLVSDPAKRIIRNNPITEKEISAFKQIKKSILNIYGDFLQLDFNMAFQNLSHLGDVSALNKRKPFLDECIFGLYLSFHPHNINIDKLK